MITHVYATPPPHASVFSRVLSFAHLRSLSKCNVQTLCTDHEMNEISMCHQMSLSREAGKCTCISYRKGSSQRCYYLLFLQFILLVTTGHFCAHVFSSSPLTSSDNVPRFELSMRTSLPALLSASSNVTKKSPKSASSKTVFWWRHCLTFSLLRELPRAGQLRLDGDSIKWAHFTHQHTGWE